MTISTKLLKITAFFTLILATSCVETVVVGSIVGGALVVQERSLDKTKDDVIIVTKLTADFVKNGLKNPGNSIDITVNEGRVLLTGISRDADKTALASSLAWKVTGVKEVIDEIQLRDDEDLKPKDFSKAFIDYLITSEVEIRLFFSKASLVNYKITTVGKVVYFLGTAADSAEMQKAIAIAAKTRGVTRVVNYLILADDSRRK